MGAEYLSYVKSIATNRPTFFGYIISVLANVNLYDKQYAVAVAHGLFTPVSDLCHLRISFWLCITYQIETLFSTINFLSLLFNSFLYILKSKNAAEMRERYLKCRIAFSF